MAAGLGVDRAGGDQEEERIGAKGYKVDGGRFAVQSLKFRT